MDLHKWYERTKRTVVQREDREVKHFDEQRAKICLLLIDRNDLDVRITYRVLNRAVTTINSRILLRGICSG